MPTALDSYWGGLRYKWSPRANGTRWNIRGTPRSTDNLFRPDHDSILNLQLFLLVKSLAAKKWRIFDSFVCSHSTSAKGSISSEAAPNSSYSFVA